MTRSAANKHKLNDIFLKNLQPADKPFLVWDSKQPGLAIRMEPSGHRAWKAIYSFHGRPRWYHLGNAIAIGVADARKLAGKIMTQVAEGKDPQAEKKAQRGAGTFEELAKRYVDEYAKKENKSYKQAEALVRKHLLPKWAKLQAAHIARSDVNTMMARLSDTPIVANAVLAAASAIFTWAIKKEIGGIKVNPCHKVDRNDTNERERVLSDSEIPKFWTAFEKEGDKHADYLRGLALKMILLTGQRPGEVRAMRSEHIKDGWWTLPKKPVPALRWPGTKNGNNKKAKDHWVWLPLPAQKILTELGATEPDATGFVFAGARGNAIDKLEEVMRAICNKLDIKDEDRATPHDLRRTHGSTITGLGFGTDAMNRIENHIVKGVTRVYDRHAYADENKKIMESVAARFMSLIDGGQDSNVLAFDRSSVR